MKQSLKTQHSEDVIRAHGLSLEDYALIVRLLGREPTYAELGIFSVMWSEHCAYRHSKAALGNFPTTGKRVLQGPGENAGALDIGDGLAVVFKVESHNHPSAVEPYQGAATGVGGILRDIHTMGARPIANLNSLCFSPPTDALTQFRIKGIVRGIADYGNCTGIPTVAGEVHFDPTFYGNPIVNAMCVGIVERDGIALSPARTPGNLLLYYGSSTGRDGIHGATFASVELDEASDARRPCVQVADPFMGKKIMEATLELIKSGLVEAIQDMGAAGLTCSSTEMAAKGGTGITLNLDEVPPRAKNMSAYEILLSESQERMLAVCSPQKVNAALEILKKWDVKGYVIGDITDTSKMKVSYKEKTVVDVPLPAVIGQCPMYQPEEKEPEYLAKIIDVTQNGVEGPIKGISVKEALARLLSLPQIASKRWIYRQFDHSVQTNTVIEPGGDAAVLRIKGTDKHIALKIDSNPLFCYIAPYEGGKHIVAEAARNVAVTGARPIGLTNCLNFGNPEKPEIFYQFNQCVLGMAEAARALETPVVSGNVSFYNETSGEAIFPAPSVGMVGLIEKGVKPVPSGFQSEGDVVLLAGNIPHHLGASTFLHYVIQNPAVGNKRRFYGPVYPLNLEEERQTIDALVKCAQMGLLHSAHDVSEGGLGVALAEACIFGGRAIGAKVSIAPVLSHIESADKAAIYSILFGEGSGAILLSCSEENVNEVKSIMSSRQINVFEIGTVCGNEVIIDDLIKVKINDLKNIYFKNPL